MEISNSREELYSCLFDDRVENNCGTFGNIKSRCFRDLIQTQPAVDEDVRIRSFAYFAFVMRRAVVLSRRPGDRGSQLMTFQICILSESVAMCSRFGRGFSRVLLSRGPSYSREWVMLSLKLSAPSRST